MTIRSRITWWHTSLVLGSILIMAVVLYYELVIERAFVSRPGHPAEPMEREITEILIFYGAPTAILTVVGGWFLLQRALAPLDALASAAEKLHMQNLHEPLPRTGNGDELDRLAEVLNLSHRRLQGAFNQIQEFTLHASHELKTPLAILYAHTETLLNDPSTSPSQREAFASQLDEIHRLTHIVEGLTFLAKADTGQINLRREEISLDELAREAHADAQILARPRKIEVILKQCDPVPIQGDRHRLRQLLLNLSDNAIKYNEAGGKVEMSLIRQENGCLFEITNSGEGVAPKDAHRVFDRFFRGNTSHHSDSEGCGLGLSIAQWIVRAHGGEIEFHSSRNQTTVRVKLPRLASNPELNISG